MIQEENLQLLASALGRKAKENELQLIIAESCSAGGLANLLCSAEGASDWFEGGFITYAKRQKPKALDISPAILATKIAVDEEIAGHQRHS